MVCIFTSCLQLMQYEVTRKQLLEKQQRKIEVMEERAEALRQARVEHEKQWAVDQR